MVMGVLNKTINGPGGIADGFFEMTSTNSEQKTSTTNPTDATGWQDAIGETVPAGEVWEINTIASSYKPAVGTNNQRAYSSQRLTIDGTTQSVDYAQNDFQAPLNASEAMSALTGILRSPVLAFPGDVVKLQVNVSNGTGTGAGGLAGSSKFCMCYQKK